MKKSEVSSIKTSLTDNLERPSKLKKTTQIAVGPIPAPTVKVIIHNKKFPIQKVSRTAMVKIINDTKGKFFTTTHIDKSGSPRTMNVIKSNKPASELGYILVYSMQDKDYRNLNPQTITDLSFNKTHYKVKK